MNYERIYIQYNDLVFDGYEMLGEYDASNTSFKVTTHPYSFRHGSYTPFKSENALTEETSVSMTLWLKEKKLPCEQRPFYRSFVIEQLTKHGKLWAVQDNTLVWAYATISSHSEMVEHYNGKVGIDIDFLLYEGVWHKADKQKTFLHPYDLCTFMDCYNYKEYQPCTGIALTPCCSEYVGIQEAEADGERVYLPLTSPQNKIKSIIARLRTPEFPMPVERTKLGIYTPEYGYYLPFFYDLPNDPFIYDGEIDFISGEVYSFGSMEDSANMTWTQNGNIWVCSDYQSVIQIPESTGDETMAWSSDFPAYSYDEFQVQSYGFCVDSSGNILVKGTQTTPLGSFYIYYETPVLVDTIDTSPMRDLLEQICEEADWKGIIDFDAAVLGYEYVELTYIKVTTTGYPRDPSDACYKEAPRPENDRYCCDCDCDEVTSDMALCYHLEDLQDVYKYCSNAGFRVIYDCRAAERFFNILGQQICADNCSNGTVAGKIYSETDIPTDGITITLVGKMHNPYVEINGNGNWIAGDYNGRLRIESNGDVYYENGCRCDDPIEPDVWQVPKGMNYGWKITPRYNRVVVDFGACCGKACAYFNIDNLTI